MRMIGATIFVTGRERRTESITIMKLMMDFGKCVCLSMHCTPVFRRGCLAAQWASLFFAICPASVHTHIYTHTSTLILNTYEVNVPDLKTNINWRTLYFHVTLFQFCFSHVALLFLLLPNVRSRKSENTMGKYIFKKIIYQRPYLSLGFLTLTTQEFGCKVCAWVFWRCLDCIWPTHTRTHTYTNTHTHTHTHAICTSM